MKVKVTFEIDYPDHWDDRTVKENLATDMTFILYDNDDVERGDRYRPVWRYGHCNGIVETLTIER